MSRYVDLTSLREYIAASGALGTQDDGLLQSCLDRAESAIDDYTRRNFVGTAGTVYLNRFEYDHVRPGGALYLHEDIVSLVAVQNGDGQTIPIGSLWLEPRNEGPPYRIVRLKSSYVWVWNTDSDVILSGTFGFGTAAPDAIKQATIRYAAHLYRQKDATGPDNTAGFDQAGAVQQPEGMPSDVRWLLAPYRSKSGGVV